MTMKCTRDLTGAPMTMKMDTPESKPVLEHTTYQSDKVNHITLIYMKMTLTFDLNLHGIINLLKIIST